MKYLVLFGLLLVLGSDIADQRPDAVNVVCQHDAANSLDENEAESFLIVGSDNVTKSYSEHDVDCPVVGPDVDLIPR